MQGQGHWEWVAGGRVMNKWGGVDCGDLNTACCGVVVFERIGIAVRSLGAGPTTNEAFVVATATSAGAGRDLRLC